MHVDLTNWKILPSPSEKNLPLCAAKKNLPGPDFHFCFIVKVGFHQKVMAKFSNLSNRHACEPKIVPELLFPVHVINRTVVTI